MGGFNGVERRLDTAKEEKPLAKWFGKKKEAGDEKLSG